MIEIRNSWSLITFISLQFFSKTLGYCEMKGISGEILSHCIGDVNNLESLIATRQHINYIKMFLEKIKNIPATLDELKSALEKRKIQLFMIIRSNLTMFYSKLPTLKGLRYLGLGANNIKTINLNILPAAKDLASLDVSKNGIKDFEEDSTMYTSTKKLESINLSHNKIDKIPVNCFYSTRESIKFIDLSHNEISRIDNYAFSHLTSLKSLLLSHNKLVIIGAFLYPARNLESLYLDHNNIQDIKAETFKASSRLNNLDLSSNSIEFIEDHAFSVLTNLETLHLNNNRIKSVKAILLRNNIHLQSLYLSFNNISYLEPGAFSLLEDLKDIRLEAALVMDLRTHVFTGLKVSELNLAGSIINKIEGTPFMTLGNNLTYLNLSSCKIQKISESAFDSFLAISILDLSNNNLTDLDYLQDNLKGRLGPLSKLFLQNNSIPEIKADTFQQLLHLTELDLSYNNIETLPPMAFKNLKHLENISVLNNQLSNTLLSNTFFGLDNVQHLELSNTKYTRWDCYALTGLKNLKVVNASHGSLEHIDYNAFSGTANIQVLDFSYNQIQNFNVTLISNEDMREIYLNNNKIAVVLKQSFQGFGVLEILNLACNNLITVDCLAFETLNALRHLDLSNNPDLNITNNLLDNLVLSRISLNNLNNNVTFKFQNVTIANLNLSSSQINDISLVYLTNIKRLNSVDLSYNNLTFIDRYSFGNGINSLKSLNLSHNKILRVNPGTFLNTNSILNLDLSYNKLEAIKFGALRGLRNLTTLNISDNELSNFHLALLYDVQSVSTLILDSNHIEYIGLTEILFSLKTLSVGQNFISCNELVHLQSHFNITLTATSFVFYSENVDGIACFSNRNASIMLGQDTDSVTSVTAVTDSVTAVTAVTESVTRPTIMYVSDLARPSTTVSLISNRNAAMMVVPDTFSVTAVTKKVTELARPSTTVSMIPSQFVPIRRPYKKHFF